MNTLVVNVDEKDGTRYFPRIFQNVMNSKCQAHQC